MDFPDEERILAGTSYGAGGADDYGPFVTLDGSIE
jgi:hypothetical protein